MLPPALYRHESDDKDDPGTTSHPPPSLPDIPDAISASVHPPSVDPHCLISPVLHFSADPNVDDAVTQSPCPNAFPLEQAVTSADPPPPSLRRSSHIRRPPTRFVDYPPPPSLRRSSRIRRPPTRFVDYDTEL